MSSDKDPPRAYTKDEIKKRFLDAVHAYAEYWSKQPNKTPLEMCDGLAFSILCVIDGSNMSFPPLLLSVDPHEDDKQYNIDNDENYYEPGTVFNDESMLHEEYYHPQS